MGSVFRHYPELSVAGRITQIIPKFKCVNFFFSNSKVSTSRIKTQSSLQIAKLNLQDPAKCSGLQSAGQFVSFCLVLAVLLKCALFTKPKLLQRESMVASLQTLVAKRVRERVLLKAQLVLKGQRAVLRREETQPLPTRLVPKIPL